MTCSKGNIRLLIISLAITLVMGEIILRAFVPQETKRFASFDKELGWRGTPRGEGVYIRKRDDIHVPYHYNNLGFRDEDVPDTAGAQFQIVILGDSFVESLEVPYESTFQDRLEEHMKAQVGASSAVINISSQGYSTAQEVIAYRKFRTILRPDIVLLAFYIGNDFDDNLREAFAFLDEQGRLNFKTNQDGWAKIQYLTIQRWLYENSHLVFFVKNTVENILGSRLAPQAKERVKASVEHATALTRSLILEMKNEVHRNGSKFGVLIFPTREEVEKGNAEKTEIIVDICREAQIPSLRLDSTLTPMHYFSHDAHLNETGHAVTAAEIVRFLSSSFNLDTISMKL